MHIPWEKVITFLAFFKLFGNVTQYPSRRGIFLELDNANML